MLDMKQAQGFILQLLIVIVVIQIIDKTIGSYSRPYLMHTHPCSYLKSDQSIFQKFGDNVQTSQSEKDMNNLNPTTIVNRDLGFITEISNKTNLKICVGIIAIIITAAQRNSTSHFLLDIIVFN